MSKPEKVEERKFVKRVRQLGAECLKQGGMGPYGMGGHSDQLCLCPFETPIFLEFKAVSDGVREEPTKRQKSRHRLYKKLGYKTFVVVSMKEAFRICRRTMRDKGVPKKIYKAWR